MSGVKNAEAYASAGYSPNGAERAASRLLKNVRIHARVMELQAECSALVVRRLVLDRNRTLNRLNQVVDLAIKDGDYRSANRALELIGRELGMFMERSQSVVWDGDMSKLTDLQLKNLLQQFGKLAGIAPENESAKAA